jgi:hypothetical protein
MALSHSPSIATNGLVLCVDPANKKSYSQNEFQNSTDLFAFYGPIPVNSGTVSRDTISSPIGNTPMRMSVTGNDPHTGSFNILASNIAPAVSGQRWIVSVYAKASQNTTGEIVMFGATSAGTAFVSGNWLNLAGSLINITTEWQRFTGIINFTNASVERLQVRFDGPETGGSGINIWWDGLQVERVPAGTTTPTSFTSLYTAGNTIRDLSGTGNNGTLRNFPTYSNDNLGKFIFNGVNNDIDCGNNSSINFGTGNFTVSLWFRRFSSATTNSRVLSKAAGDDIADAATAGFAFFGNNGGINFAVNPTGTRTIISAATYSLNEWVNVVGVVERGVNMRSFKNANLVDSTTAPVGSVSGTTSLFIGCNAGINVFWAGEVSNVLIYNRALTNAEIQQNFNAHRGRYGI